MLMPDKHIKFSESLLGLGAYVLEALSSPQTIDDLWYGFCRARSAELYPSQHSFENLVLAVDTLFAIGAVSELDQSGVLQRCI